MRHLLIALAAFVPLAGIASAEAATLDDVMARGTVSCGVHTGLLGYAAPDNAGRWAGFDVDYCRALAAAIFNDADAVTFSPLSASERFTALQGTSVDLLARITTWTMSRDTTLGLNFAAVNYFDGQGFLVRRADGFTSAADLNGGSICVQTGTTTELNVTDFFAANNMTFNPVVFERIDEATAAYESGRCDAYTSDASGLYGTRLTLASPGDHMVLSDVISKEPLSLAVRQGDDQWFDIVKWLHNALLNAEELGVTSENVDEMLNSENVNIRRLLGTEGTFGESIGLSNAWAYQAIKLVGNYGEIFDRNLGAGSPIGIARGLNALWTNGGLQYALPIR
ncbi:MAG: amino acid ABC transporter substrate-binding protein [Bauldia sp.]|nr:amino acid ABC transporter substrate-binding protein [Bauldia sp.]